MGYSLVLFSVMYLPQRVFFGMAYTGVGTVLCTAIAQSDVHFSNGKYDSLMPDDATTSSVTFSGDCDVP